MSVCRLLLKIILLPVSLILLLIKGVINLVINLTSVVVGLFTLYIGFALFYCLISQRWRDLMFFSVIGVITIVVIFYAMLLEEFLNDLRQKIKEL